jgi:RNA polymerase sigma-70 factor (ECF subfamily)
MEMPRPGHSPQVMSASLRERPPATPDFDEVYETHVDAVWRLLQRSGVPEAELEDAVQEVFLVAHRRLADFRGESSVKTWLFGVGLRVAKDARRRLSRKGGHDALDDHGHLPSPHGLEEQTMHRQAFTQLLRLLESLGEELREVFVLAELEELTAPELSATLGVNVNTVYSRMRTARLRFDALVAERGQETR